MDQEEEEVSKQNNQVTIEEPQLTYWNPWRKGRSVFTATSSPIAPTIGPLSFIKMDPQISSFSDPPTFSNVHSPVYNNHSDNSQNEYQNLSDFSITPSSFITGENENGSNTLTTLDSSSPRSLPLGISFQEEEKRAFIKQEPKEETDDFSSQNVQNDIMIFNSIDEALDSIDPPSTIDFSQSVPVNSLQGIGNRMGLTNEKHEEVVKAAKSLFSKRTRTLYHWLFPYTSKTKLKATVSAAWETLSEEEKHFYISQVLGRFGLQASSLMINPQLGGMKCLPNETDNNIAKENNALLEDQQAVDSLFNSCKDAGNWESYSEPQHIASKPKQKTERKQRRKRQKEKNNDDVGSINIQMEQDIKNLKKHRKVHKELEDFEEDPELTKELEKFRLITEAAEEDIWGDIQDPDDIFAEMDF